MYCDPKVNSTRLLIQDRYYPNDLRTAKNIFEQQYLTEMLIRNSGNVAKTARQIKIGRRNLQDKIAKHNIDISAIRAGVVQSSSPSKQAIIKAIKLIENYVQT